MPKPEPPVEMMPMDEGLGIFNTEVMPGHGLIAEAFYPGYQLKQLPDFETLTPSRTWMVANIDVPSGSYTQGSPERGEDVLENFAIRLRGQIKIETAGVYYFRITSDDGSKLFINGAPIIDIDGLRGISTKFNGVILDAGFYDIEIQYIQGPFEIGLYWDWQTPDGVAGIVPPEVLYPPGTGEVSGR